MLVNTVIKDRICYVEMQNAEHFNCLSDAMCQELMAALKEGYANECAGIVLKAKTRKGVWSAGHDIRELPTDGTDPLSFIVPMERLLREVQDTPIPVIACVDGTVWGGACDLCLSCDMIVSSKDATFAITPAKIGIPYNASGILHFIHQLGMNKAREMFFLGMPILAEDALNVGLINRVTDADKLEEQLAAIGELSTASFEYTNTRTVTDTRQLFGMDIPGTTNKVTITYEGVIKVSYDVEQIGFTIDGDEGVIYVTLPEPQITDNYIRFDSIDIESSNNILNPINIDNLSAYFGNYQDEGIRKAEELNIWEEAEDRMMLLVDNFLSRFSGYEIRYGE